MAQDNPILAQAASSTDINTALVTSPSDSVDQSLQAIQEALTKSASRIAGSIVSLEQGAKESKVATDVIVSSVQDITAANQVTQLAKDTANLQAQNHTIEAFELAGGVPAQTALAASLAEDNAQVDSILETRDELANVDRGDEGIGIIDNIINGFNIALTNQQLKSAVAKRDNTVAQIANTTGATESFARQNALTKKTLNEGVIEANYRAIGAEGNLKAAQAELVNINSNSTVMTNLMQADARNTQNLLSVYRLEGEAQDREIKVERQKFAREQMAVEREQWKLNLPKAKVQLEQMKLNLERSKSLTPTQVAQAEVNLARTEKAHNDLIALEDSLVISVQKGQSLSGTPIESREAIIFGLNQSGDTGKKYARLQEMGGSPDAVLGLDPASAKEALDIVAPSGNIKANAGTKLLAQVAEVQAAKYAPKVVKGKKVAGDKIPKNQAGLDADFNQTAKELEAVFSSNIVTGDTTNPYVAPVFTVIEGFKSVTDTPLYQKVLAPMGMKETNPQTILDAAIAGVLAKVVTPEQAASGIEAIFDAAALYNNTQDGGFRRVGMTNQTTYNTTIAREPTLFEELSTGFSSLAIRPFGRSKEVVDARIAKRVTPIDLMDGTKLQKLIIESLSSTKAAAPSASNASNP